MVRIVLDEEDTRLYQQIYDEHKDRPDSHLWKSARDGVSELVLLADKPIFTATKTLAVSRRMDDAFPVYYHAVIDWCTQRKYQYLIEYSSAYRGRPGHANVSVIAISQDAPHPIYKDDSLPDPGTPAFGILCQIEHQLGRKRDNHDVTMTFKLPPATDTKEEDGVRHRAIIGWCQARDIPFSFYKYTFSASDYLFLLILSVDDRNPEQRWRDERDSHVNIFYYTRLNATTCLITSFEEYAMEADQFHRLVLVLRKYKEILQSCIHFVMNLRFDRNAYVAARGARQCAPVSGYFQLARIWNSEQAMALRAFLPALRLALEQAADIRVAWLRRQLTGVDDDDVTPESIDTLESFVRIHVNITQRCIAGGSNIPYLDPPNRFKRLLGEMASRQQSVGDGVHYARVINRIKNMVELALEGELWC